MCKKRIFHFSFDFFISSLSQNKRMKKWLQKVMEKSMAMIATTKATTSRIWSVFLAPDFLLALLCRECDCVTKTVKGSKQSNRQKDERIHFKP
jgi:hypothetical protein